MDNMTSEDNMTYGNNTDNYTSSNGSWYDNSSDQKDNMTYDDGNMSGSYGNNTDNYTSSNGSWYDNSSDQKDNMTYDDDNMSSSYGNNTDNYTWYDNSGDQKGCDLAVLETCNASVHNVSAYVSSVNISAINGTEAYDMCMMWISAEACLNASGCCDYYFDDDKNFLPANLMQQGMPNCSEIVPHTPACFQGDRDHDDHGYDDGHGGGSNYSNGSGDGVGGNGSQHQEQIPLNSLTPASDLDCDSLQYPVLEWEWRGG
ncbi:unnamed protein product [Symbiodinium natans]|uniref:Uncharacterized protein n=1 Tax=Symbiodinium natans TaxID=878477 RepID=A0A812RJ52_9DINO|nr:unnamed protein product [Symbiodinium natans]